MKIRSNTRMLSVCLAVIAGLVSSTAYGQATDVVCDKCIDNSDLNNNSVGTARIINEAVTSAKIKNEAISTPKIKGGAITSGKIKDGTVRAIDIDSSQVQSRVQACAANSSIRMVNDDGTVVCDVDDDSGFGFVPIAFGYINTNGTTASGSGNFSAIWDAGSNWYEISIDNENYFFSSYVTVVTVGSESADMVRTSSLNDDLLVIVTDNSDARIQSGFQFVTFKP